MVSDWKFKVSDVHIMETNGVGTPIAIPVNVIDSTIVPHSESEEADENMIYTFKTDPIELDVKMSDAGVKMLEDIYTYGAVIKYQKVLSKALKQKSRRRMCLRAYRQMVRAQMKRWKTAIRLECK